MLGGHQGSTNPPPPGHQPQLRSGSLRSRSTRGQVLITSTWPDDEIRGGGLQEATRLSIKDQQTKAPGEPGDAVASGRPHGRRDEPEEHHNSSVRPLGVNKAAVSFVEKLRPAAQFIPESRSEESLTLRLVTRVARRELGGLP